MRPRPTLLLLFLSLAVVLGAAVLVTRATDSPGPQEPVVGVQEIEPALTVEKASVEQKPIEPASQENLPILTVEAERTQSIDVVLQPRIAPGTPPEYWANYLAGYTPSEILEDGTQVYKDIPYYVRQPDGTMKKELATMKIKPVPALPTLEEAQDGSARGR
jgi:hypothetical protein